MGPPGLRRGSPVAIVNEVALGVGPLGPARISIRGVLAHCHKSPGLHPFALEGAKGVEPWPRAGTSTGSQPQIC